jgi:hypothetical protein
MHNNDKIIKMNKETFENNLRIIKESRTKQGKEINHLNDKEFVKWLKDNGLIHWLK